MNREPGSKTRILLTGAAGFIGSAVARLAVSRGHSVLGLARPEQVESLGDTTDREVEFVGGSLEDAPWGEIRQFEPDVCIHTAWISKPGVYLEAAENRDLVVQSSAFLERAAEVGVGFALVLGTCIEYAPSETELNETLSRVAPSSLYARCKNELRELLESDLPGRGMGLSWGRVFYPYGVGEHPQRLCSSVFSKLSKGEEVLLKTPNSIKDYIYISDLAAAMLKVVESRRTGVINLGTGCGTSVLELAKTVGEVLGRPGLVRAAAEPAHDPYPYVVADANRLRSLGWEPKINLKDGVSRLIEHLQRGGRK